MSNSAHTLCPDFRGINALTVVRSSWCMRVLFLCLVISVELTGGEVSAQVVQNTMWQNTIGSYQEDELTDVLLLTDKKILTIGYSNSSIGHDKSEHHLEYGYHDYWVVMLDSTGNKLWDEMYGGASMDYLTSAAQTPDGGFLLAGSSESEAGFDKTENNRGVGSDYWVIRIDSLGNTVWDISYGGTNSDMINKVISTIDSCYLLIGWSISNAGYEKSESPKGGGTNADYWIVKINGLGEVLWENTIGGSRDDMPIDGLQTADGGFLILGKSDSQAGFDKSVSQHGLPGIPRDDFWLVKLSAAGVVEWDSTYGGTEHDVPDGILDCNDGTYLLYGYSYSAPGYEKTEGHKGYGDYWMVKVDVNGSILWDKTIGASSSDRATGAVKIHDNYFIVGGNSSSEADGDKTEVLIGGLDLWLVGIDGTGQVQWDDVIGCEAIDALVTMYAYPDASLILGATSVSDTCSDKSELNKGGAVNDEDYWIFNRAKYQYYYKSVSDMACFDSTYILPWGEMVDAYGVYYDTIPGEFLDTLYQFALEEIILNDSLIVNPYFIYTHECISAVYTWISCDSGDTLVSGEYACWLDVFEDGNYAVIIEYDECIDTSDCVFAEGWLAIGHQAPGEIILYPNPGNGVFQLQGLQTGTLIEIRNLLGQLIYSAVSAQPEAMIDIKEQASGIYRIVATYKGKQTELRYLKLQ